jgi:hypothetical protein
VSINVTIVPGTLFNGKTLMRREHNDVGFLPRRERADLWFEVSRSSAGDRCHLDHIAEGQERRQIFLTSERAFVDERALQCEGCAHDRKHVCGHVAFDIDAEARLDAVVERRLQWRHAVPHLHLDRGCDRDLPAGDAYHFPMRLAELGAVNVFIIGTHQSGLADRLEIAGAVADDMADDRDAGLPRQCPVVGVGDGVQLERQQLVSGGEILRL